MTTINKLSEQVSRLAARFVDRENIKPLADKREMKIYLEQAINELLKAEFMQARRYGEFEIPNCMIITYTGQTVVQDTPNARAYVDLPAIPVHLPKNMGVWSVTKANNPLSAYIPIPMDFLEVMGTTNVSYLEQQIGYYVYGKRIYFNKDITLAANGSVSSVDLKLLVSDFSNFTDTELLPINADMEAMVVQRTIEKLGLGRLTIEQINQELLNGKVNANQNA